MSATAAFVKEHALENIDINSKLESWAIATVNNALEKDTEKSILGKMRDVILAGRAQKVLIARSYYHDRYLLGIIVPYDYVNNVYDQVDDNLAVSMSKELITLCVNRTRGKKPFHVLAPGGATIEFNHGHHYRCGRGMDYIEIYLTIPPQKGR